ncbi:MAG TPA: site-specific integrase [Gallionella sp.]|nr:site-specific integrase [Gallionella sp.]
MATIRQRGTKWQCIIKRTGYPPQTKTFELKRDAEKWGRLQEREIDSGQWVDRTEAERTTLGDLLERYAKEVSTTKRGKDIEVIRLDAIRHSTLAKHSAATISGKLIASWRDSRLQRVSSGTVLREMQLLNHVFAVAIRDWGIALHSNPVSHIRKPPAGKPRDRVLTDAQRAALIAACGQCRNPWVQPVVIFALETAARRGEIKALTWDGVDLQRGTAKLRITKTGDPRTVPLSPACIAMLRSLPRSIDGYVFPVTIQALKQAYERAVARAGIDDFTFHDLRHDALTRLSKMGFSVLELRAISGHTTTTMLQRYVSIDAGDLASRLAAIGRIA